MAATHLHRVKHPLVLVNLFNYILNQVRHLNSNIAWSFMSFSCKVNFFVQSYFTG